MAKFNYRELAALTAYLDRIKAEQRNFRRYVVKEQTRSRYFHDKYIVTLDGDGDLTVREARGGEVPEETLPTKAEQEAIKAELAKAKFPQWLHASDAKLDDLRTMLRRKGHGEPRLFVFRDPKTGAIPFVQQRIVDGDGDKKDLPWSLWEGDGIGWECMEPDDLLPLFGLETIKDVAVVFLHEGAKAADHVQWLVGTKLDLTNGDERQKAMADCPWLPSLKRAAHVGWPGGAPNPHRVDWSSLATLPPDVRVIMVCDNDALGENAAPYISRALRRRMWVVRFGQAFPGKFDLADAFPPELFADKKGQRVYKGPSLEDCTEPATWATIGKDRLRPEFVEEWYYTVKPAVFVNSSNLQRRYDESEFNVNIAPFSDVTNVAVMLRRFPSAKAEKLVYEPAEPCGRIAFDKAQVINIYQPSPIKPRKGDVALFEKYLTHLIPDEDDRAQLKQWIATLIARPDIRMGYGLLLISHTQGIGKTTLAEKILVPLVGLPNCSFPTPKMAVDSQFTSWQAFKRLAVIAEIYDGHTAKAYNQLKTAITDLHVDVNEKYEKSFKINNYVHLVASSNSFRALKLDDQDRRWFVPGVTEEPKPHSWWLQLNEYLQSDDGLPAIAWWAHEYVREHGPVAVGLHAPMSAAKRRTIEEGRSEGEKMIADFAQDLATMSKDRQGKQGTLQPIEIVVRLDELRKWLASQKAGLNQRDFGPDGQLKLESPERIASLLRSAGLHLPTKQFKAEGERFRVVANFDPGTDLDWATLRGRCWTPGKVKGEAGKEAPF
jgi:hypothetical protein